MTAPGTIPGFTKPELQHFEEMLLERRRLLADDLHALEEEHFRNTSEVPAAASHMAELGSDRAAADVSLGRRESACEEIQQIDEALDRIEDGSYGHCETCEEPMSPVRMEAIPYARLCLACKLAEER